MVTTPPANNNLAELCKYCPSNENCYNTDGSIYYNVDLKMDANDEYVKDYRQAVKNISLTNQEISLLRKSNELNYYQQHLHKLYSKNLYITTIFLCYLIGYSLLTRITQSPLHGLLTLGTFSYILTIVIINIRSYQRSTQYFSQLNFDMDSEGHPDSLQPASCTECPKPTKKS